MACVLLLAGIFFSASFLVDFGGRKDEEEGVSRPWEEGEEIRVGEGEDFVELKGRREAEIVDERCHDFGIIFWP